MSMTETVKFLIAQPLLGLAVAAILLSTLGGMIRRATPLLGGFIRGLGNLGLVAALLLTIVQAARFTTGNDIAIEAVPGFEPSSPLRMDDPHARRAPAAPRHAHRPHAHGKPNGDAARATKRRKRRRFEQAGPRKAT